MPTWAVMIETLKNAKHKKDFMRVFITGGTTGIGLELAKLYLKEGHDVGICGRDLGKLSSDIKSHPRLRCYQVDVRVRNEINMAVGDFSQLGLDVMVANAGRSVGGKTKTPNFDAAIDVMNVNVMGLLYTFEAALKYMIPAKRGQLVGIASVAGMVGLPGASSYSASKAAVVKLCESYSLDLAAQGIAVTTIMPGFIDTPLTKKNNHSMPFLMGAEEGALKIKRAIDAKKIVYIFPLRMKIVMTLLEIMPRFLYRRLMSLPMFNYSV